MDDEDREDSETARDKWRAEARGTRGSEAPAESGEMVTEAMRNMRDMVQKVEESRPSDVHRASRNQATSSSTQRIVVMDNAPATPPMREAILLWGGIMGVVRDWTMLSPYQDQM